MLLDILIVGCLVYGLAKLLNATAFKSAPAKPWIAWSLTAAVWIACFLALLMLKVLAYKSIAADLGVPGLASSGPKPNVVFPLLFSWLFFVSLNRKNRSVRPTTSDEKASLNPPIQQQPIKSESEGHTALSSSHLNGWHRLGIAASVLWGMLVLSYAGYSCMDGSCEIRRVIATLLLTITAPIVVAWSLAYTAYWIRQGFRK